MSTPAEGAPSGRPTRRASAGALAAMQRRSTPTRAPRKKRPTTDLIGRRISISWPQDKSFYEARCIDYNTRTKLHKVIYFEDDSIEELSLAKRKWKLVEEVLPDPDPEGPHALVGKIIILPAKASDTLNPAAPENDFRACVQSVVTEENPVEPPIDPTVTLQPAPVMHQVVYLANDFIAIVDLSSVKYIIVDNVTGDAIRTVNADKGAVSLDLPEDIELVSNGDGDAALAPAPGGNGSVAPIEEEIVASGNATSDPVPSTTEEAPKVDMAAAIAKTNQDKESLVTSAGVPPKEIEASDNTASAPKALPSSFVVPSDQSAVATAKSSLGASSETAAAPSAKSAEGREPGTSVTAITATEAPVAGSSSSLPTNSGLEAQSVLPTTPSKSDKPANEKSAVTPPEPGLTEAVQAPVVEKVAIPDTNAMAHSAAAAAAAMAVIEEDEVAATAAVVLPDISMDEFPTPEPVSAGSNIAALVSDPFGGATGKPPVAPETEDAPVPSVIHPNGAAGAVNETGNKFGASSNEIVFDAAADTAQVKPLTKENLNMLDSATAAAENKQAGDGAAIAAASILPGTSAQVPEKDEETRTVSDVEEAAWVASSPRSSDRFAESRVNKYIALIDGDSKVMRKAYVEAYFQERQTHFVAFCDSTGGNMQVRLTEQNHRLLNQEEIDTLSKRLALSDEQRSPGRSSRKGSSTRTPSSLALQHTAGTRRRSASGGEDEKVFKRHRRNSEPAPGAELIGRCITVRWPGNGGNYVALVVGFLDKGPNNRMHKVYYVADESTEILNLAKREWVREGPGTEPWDRNGLVGKRLYVYWDGEYADDRGEDQRRAEEKFGKGKTKVPFEAFVVQFIDSFRYRLLYTQDDNLEDRDLTQEDEAWDVLEPGVMKVDNMSVISWSSGTMSNC